MRGKQHSSPVRHVRKRLHKTHATPGEPIGDDFIVHDRPEAENLLAVCGGELGFGKANGPRHT